jgi:hypothetical protein
MAGLPSWVSVTTSPSANGRRESTSMPTSYKMTSQSSPANSVTHLQATATLQQLHQTLFPPCQLVSELPQRLASWRKLACLICLSSLLAQQARCRSPLMYWHLGVAMAGLIWMLQ